MLRGDAPSRGRRLERFDRDEREVRAVEAVLDDVVVKRRSGGPMRRIVEAEEAGEAVLRAGIVADSEREELARMSLIARA